MSHIGKLESEVVAEENEHCRKIANEISRFGISERQRMYLIYLMALEFERIDWLQETTAFVRSLAGKEILLIDRDEGVEGGKTNV